VSLDERLKKWPCVSRFAAQRVVILRTQPSGTKNGAWALEPNFEPRWTLRYFSQQRNRCASRESTRTSVVCVCGVFSAR